ncbi:hypothetical protein CFP65_3035 [Kitasatospora sp. MMS16-BH015]|nr:hypothetical protein CFP65_3035 [Kitasatospora sp. MMS16-BH015]
MHRKKEPTTRPLPAGPRPTGPRLLLTGAALALAGLVVTGCTSSSSSSSSAASASSSGSGSASASASASASTAAPNTSNQLQDDY